MLIAAKRFVVNLLVSLLVLVVGASILPGFKLESALSAVFGVVILSILNSSVRPIIVRLTLPLTMLSFGGLAIVLNGVLVLITSWLNPGFHVANLFTAIVISFGLALANMFVASSLLIGADERFHEYQVIKRFARKSPAAGQMTTPGLILIEIDGLSEPVLRQAIKGGQMPTLAAWLETGRYRLVQWDTGLPAQTSAMQAGILHGSHHNIPAFRFYDKRRQRLLVSGHPPDAADILKGIVDGHGLLKERGFSVNNWAHGDAHDVVLTMSTLALQVRSAVLQSEDLFGYFANAYYLQRGLIKMAIDVVVEIWEAWSQQRRDIRPRVERRFPYPLVRALTTALLPDLSCYLLIQKMFEGIDVAYSTLVSYDEVAHHSGIDRSDARRVLRQIDGQIRWVSKAVAFAPRRYDVVVLSDHGQSQGATFRQRFGMTLHDLVTALVAEEYAPAPATHQDEGIERINVLVNQLAWAERMRSRILRWLFRTRTSDGLIDLRPRAKRQEAKPPKTVVCASGNLGLIYFTEWSERLSLEDMESRFPGLVSGLVQHPGIGFVMAYSTGKGSVVLGKSGAYYLRDDSVVGDDPLAPFGPNAARHLREVSEYPCQGDLVVNSLYDPATGDVAAFEELVGSHGGLGGPQNQPFLFYPSWLDLDRPPTDLIGAPSIYQTFQAWRKREGTAKISH